MNLKEYQAFARNQELDTSTRDYLYHNLIREIGSIAGTIAQHQQDIWLDDNKNSLLLDDLSSITWFLAKISNYLDLNLSHENNLYKNDWKVYGHLFTVAEDFNTYVLTEATLNKALTAVASLADNCGYSLNEVLQYSERKLNRRFEILA